MLEIKEKLNKISAFPKNVLYHAGCTASTMVNPKTHLDLVRIGIGLYGLWPSQATIEGSTFQLKPALTWKTKIIQIKELARGSLIGYACAYKCKKKTRIAILSVGYWDGYDRALSNPPTLKLRRAGCGQVLIRGRRAPIRGRICMNMMMVDITKIPNVRVGDEVVLIGEQKTNNKKPIINNFITAEELATKINTINYEVVTRINPLLPRIYK